MLKQMNQRTWTPKGAAAAAQRKWYVIDAEGQTLGRVATVVARLLRGKHKPNFTPHMDMGDFVVIINASKIVVTGNKLTQKMYYRHSNYPGGFRITPYQDLVKKHPTAPMEKAVRGMLPQNNLGDQLYRKLHIYAGPTHPHAAQNPQVFMLGAETAENGQNS